MDAHQFEEENAIHFLKQKFGLPAHFKRPDIAVHFEYPRHLSTRKIFERKGLDYFPNVVSGCRRTTPVFIKEINGDDVERFPSIKNFCEKVLLSESNSSTVLDYVNNQYLIKYDNRLFTASFTGDFPGFYRGFEVNPYNRLKIRQQMREIGLYNGTILTVNEICEWYFVNPQSENVIRQLCDILDLPYMTNIFGGPRQRQPCSFRNLLTNDVSDFTSFNDAGRRLGVDKTTIARNFRERRRFHAGNIPYQAV